SGTCGHMHYTAVGLVEGRQPLGNKSVSGTTRSHYWALIRLILLCLSGMQIVVRPVSIATSAPLATDWPNPEETRLNQTRPCHLCKHCCLKYGHKDCSR